MTPDSSQSHASHREPKGGRGRGVQIASVPRISFIRLPLMIAVITYLLCLLLAAIGIHEFVTRFVSAALVACVLGASIELAIGWRDENK